MRKQLLMAIASVAALAAVALATDDPFVGTWKLNVAKSKTTDPSTMQKSATVKNEGIDNGQKSIGDGVDADGKTFHSEWTGKYDGKDYPVKGDPTVDTSSLKKIDTNTFVGVDKKAGKEVSRSKFVFSKDGKMVTVTGKGKNPKGKEYDFTAVYEKQ